DGVTMKIGSYDLHAIETGRFALDGGAMFGVVPRPLWEKTNPPDERNRIAMAARVLLLVGDGRRILVDTGNGDKFDQKFASIYKMEGGREVMVASLARHHLTPGDITDVILTHLHFDHAGGATCREGEHIVPAFPNATYHVQQRHWEAALHPTDRDRASFLPGDFMPLHEAGVLKFIHGEEEILPGIRARLVHGHTTALQCPLISDGQSSLLYCADLVPLASHLHLPWIMAYDLRPLVTLEEKRTTLDRAVDEQWVMFFEHDPVLTAGYVERTGKGFTLGQTLTME
ncbi:MAG: Glyoxylase, beta-lactamase superfamily, partial [Bacteroidetes bacterium]|nr:Glyoxylase, beta-lactamase superfamily [Bacteroidota bacterium]